MRKYRPWELEYKEMVKETKSEMEDHKFGREIKKKEAVKNVIRKIRQKLFG
jgi:hypothetical protein